MEQKFTNETWWAVHTVIHFGINHEAGNLENYIIPNFETYFEEEENICEKIYCELISILDYEHHKDGFYLENPQLQESRSFADKKTSALYARNAHQGFSMTFDNKQKTLRMRFSGERAIEIQITIHCLRAGRTEYGINIGKRYEQWENNSLLGLAKRLMN